MENITHNQLRIILALLSDIQRECETSEVGFQLPGTTTSSMAYPLDDTYSFIGYVYLIGESEEYTCDCFLSLKENKLQFIYDTLKGHYHLVHIKDGNGLNETVWKVKQALELMI